MLGNILKIKLKYYKNTPLYIIGGSKMLKCKIKGSEWKIRTHFGYSIYMECFYYYDKNEIRVESFSEMRRQLKVAINNIFQYVDPYEFPRFCNRHMLNILDYCYYTKNKDKDISVFKYRETLLSSSNIGVTNNELQDGKKLTDDQKYYFARLIQKTLKIRNRKPGTYKLEIPPELKEKLDKKLLAENKNLNVDSFLIATLYKFLDEGI